MDAKEHAAVNFIAPDAPPFAAYAGKLARHLDDFDWRPAETLARDLLDCWRTGRQVFIAGNGGSAANAVHLASDFLYAFSKQKGSGLRVHSLAANPAVLTCLGNDEGYEQVFAYQLAVQARSDDVLIVFSGSGNSPNILLALEEARRLQMKSYAVLGFDGGKAKALADVPIHFAIDDMRMAEDFQLILGHVISAWLSDYASGKA
jgi:D-sedoheptulose 7-phosphate isomerase